MSARPASGRRASNYGRSTFGRGRGSFSRSRLFSSSRRVVVKARVARHQGRSFRSAPLSAHLSYLKREGVSRDGEKGVMFDAELRPCRRSRLRRSVQGRPAPFPLHRLARGSRRAHRPQGVHPRSCEPDGNRYRDASRLGRRRSLEHRQSACPSARARRGRERRRPRDLARLYQPGPALACRGSDVDRAWPQARARHPQRPGEGSLPPSGGRASISRSAIMPTISAPSTCGPETRGPADPEIRRLMIGRLQHLEKMGLDRRGRSRRMDGRARSRAPSARPRDARRHHQDNAPHLHRARRGSRRRRLRHRRQCRRADRRPASRQGSP